MAYSICSPRTSRPTTCPSTNCRIWRSFDATRLMQCRQMAHALWTVSRANVSSARLPIVTTLTFAASAMVSLHHVLLSLDVLMVTISLMVSATPAQSAAQLAQAQQSARPVSQDWYLVKLSRLCLLQTWLESLPSVKLWHQGLVIVRSASLEPSITQATMWLVTNATRLATLVPRQTSSAPRAKLLSFWLLCKAKQFVPLPALPWFLTTMEKRQTRLACLVRATASLAQVPRGVLTVLTSMPPSFIR
jgi:hypothetical protein